MGKTCHLPGTRNQLQGNRGTGELPTLPEQHYFALGRPAIDLNDYHFDKYASFQDIPEINDGPIKNAVRYLEEHNLDHKGEVIPANRIVLGLFSDSIFSDLVSRIIDERGYTNTTARHLRKHSVAIGRDIRGAYREIADDDSALALKIIQEKTRESSVVQKIEKDDEDIVETLEYIVDPGPSVRLLSRTVLLESRYVDRGDGVLRASLDLSDRETRNGFEDDAGFINEVLEKAGLGKYRFIFDELDATLPLFSKKQTPRSTRGVSLDTPEIPPKIDLMPITVVS